MFKKLLLTTAACVCLIGHALATESTPINVKIIPYGNNYIVKITAIVDNVIVNGVKLNRGNCTYSESHAAGHLITSSNSTVTLKYGEIYTIETACINLIEVMVETDQGTWTLNTMD